MSRILVNFSGHSLAQETEMQLRARFQEVFSVPPIEFDFSADVETQISRILATLPFSVDGTRSLTIIPPGQSTVAILLVSYLHGVLGHFPSLCYLELSEGGLYLPRFEYLFNPQKARSRGRIWRAESFKKN